MLSGEELDVGIERVPVERVRASKRIVTTTRMVEVEVRHEELVITREPVGRTDVAAGAAGEAEDIVVVLHAEEPEVVLRTRALEQVSVRVRRVEGDQLVEADLRRERAEVEVVDKTRRD